MSNVGIPMWVFQVQPRNSKAREPTIMNFIKKLAHTHYYFPKASAMQYTSWIRSLGL